MTKKKIDRDLTKMKAFLIPVLRRASYRWPARNSALKNARVSPGKYQCKLCESIVGAREVDIDHINPIVPIETGFIDWNSFIDRLFCEEEGLQIICKQCHATKTLTERELRKEFRKIKKVQDENSLL